MGVLPFSLLLFETGFSRSRSGVKVGQLAIHKNPKKKNILESRMTTSRFSVSAEVMPFDGKGVFAQGSDAVYLCLVFVYGSTSLMPGSTKKLNIDTPLQKTV